MVNYKNNQCFDVLIKYTPTIASTIPPNNLKLNFSFKKTIPNINVKITIRGSMVGMTTDKESLLRSKYKNAVKQMDLLIKNKEKDKAKKYFAKFQSILMQVAKTGIISRNTAGRKISKISKKILSK